MLVDNVLVIFRNLFVNLMEMILKMKITFQRIGTISTKEFYEICKMRNEVFVVEQGCAYQELDEYDLICTHVTLQNENDTIIGYARIIPPKTKYEDAYSIGRFLIKKEYRNKGYAKRFLENIIDYIDGGLIRLSSQEYIKNFYEEFGFKQVGEVYMESLRPHVLMEGNFKSRNRYGKIKNR